jgi:6,7-dimethyl-8-ribityllumazine synthase
VSGSGAPTLATVDGHGLRVAVVSAQWHEEIMDALRAGADRALDEMSVSRRTHVQVPGTFELSVAAAQLADGHDAVVALGVVVRGDTPHFDYVCQAATVGLTQVSVSLRRPVGFGVLTCDTFEQARLRSGLPGSKEDKGYEATQAAVLTAIRLREAQDAADLG